MTTPERCLVERLGAAVAGVHDLLDQLAAADELITALVAENEDLRRRLAGFDAPCRVPGCR